MTGNPAVEQSDRDRLSDPDLPDRDEQVGGGPHANHAEELMPS